ncbi:MAG: hypothetical protein OEQ90_05575 [Gammaproteobacteria bacterium]|nr:hypothetical protein [Gammaproteobacteria bacterium]
MCRINIAIVILGALTMINVDIASGASPEPNADRCFEETVRVANGAEPATLSTTACRRALRVKPLSRQDRSAILYNSGIIQQAQGNLAAAKASFERAARLSKTVDMRNLALAQVALKLGDYRVAFEQYDLLAASDFAADSEKVRVSVVANREQALHALNLTGVAANQR